MPTRGAVLTDRHTFRDGLLTATPATSDETRLASASKGVTGESRPFSLFLPTVDSRSCFIGLEKSGASLLGTGVMAAAALVKALFVSEEAGVLLAGVGSDGEGVGELVDFFWKKPRMDFWFLADCETEAGCFF